MDTLKLDGGDDHDVQLDAQRGSTDAPPGKPWYASTGVWGGVITLLGSMLSLLKVQVDPQLLDDLRQWVLSLVTLIGGAIALWGRIRATRRIGATRAGPPVLALMLMLAIPCLGGGCATTLDDAYASADRATYDAVAPEYAKYVANDPTLSAEQRDRRNRTVAMWRLRVEDEARRAQLGTKEGLATDGAQIHTD